MNVVWERYEDEDGWYGLVYDEDTNDFDGVGVFYRSPSFPTKAALRGHMGIIYPAIKGGMESVNDYIVGAFA